MSFIHKAIIRAYKSPRPGPTGELSIRLHEGGSVFHGLTVVDAWPGPRDLSVLPGEHRKGASGNLVSPGHVDFITAKGKKWSIKFSEFSFLFNPRSLAKADAEEAA